MRNWVVILLLCSSYLAYAQNPTAFDGTWDVTISCTNVAEGTGARGYTYQFVAEVKHGVLHAQHRVPDTAGSLRLEGKIPPDGVAELHAYGRTGNPDYAVKRPSEGTPYTYRIQAKFVGMRGTGDRIDSRPCGFAFSKR